MERSYNLRNPAVKRLMREAEELRNPSEEYYAQPLEENLFEWHFTVRGPPNTDFDGGVYHGRITLPPEYPMKPPSIILLTPNGRFEINKKICLSISGHHPESWQPSWSIRTALLAIIGFMPTHANGAIGALDYTTEERQALARKSQAWKCTNCGHIHNLLKKDNSGTESKQILSESTQQPVSVVALPKINGTKPQCSESVGVQEPGENSTGDSNDVNVQSDTVSNITTAAGLPTTPLTVEAELEHSSEHISSPSVSAVRQRLSHSDRENRETDQSSSRIQPSIGRNASVLPSPVTSTTFIGILTFLLLFLLLRRLSTYIDCF